MGNEVTPYTLSFWSSQSGAWVQVGGFVDRQPFSVARVSVARTLVLDNFMIVEVKFLPRR